MTEQGRVPSVPSVPQQLVRAKEIWEWGSWAVSATGTVVAFIKSVGGVLGFLSQIAYFGFACYIAAIPVVMIVLLLFSMLDKTSGRQTYDNVLIGAAVIGVLVGGFLIRTQLFYDGIGEPGDIDAIGTVFVSVVGLAILLTPIYFIWRQYGSNKT